MLLFVVLVLGCLTGAILGFTYQLWSLDGPLGAVIGGLSLSSCCVVVTLAFGFTLTVSMQGCLFALLFIAVSYIVISRYFLHSNDLL